MLLLVSQPGPPPVNSLVTWLLRASNFAQEQLRKAGQLAAIKEQTRDLLRDETDVNKEKA